MDLRKLLEKFYYDSHYGTKISNGHVHDRRKERTEFKVNEFMIKNEQLFKDMGYNIPKHVYKTPPSYKNMNSTWWTPSSLVYTFLFKTDSNEIVDLKKEEHFLHAEQIITNFIIEGKYIPIGIMLNKKELLIGSKFELAHAAGIGIVDEFLLTSEGPVVIFHRDGGSVHFKQRVLPKNIATIF